LANIAVLLARKGLRVLAVDWDLEAPGLERYFREFEPPDFNLGLLDLLWDALSAVPSERQPDWHRYISQISVGGQWPLTLLSSGRDDQEYAARVLKFDWPVFFTQHKGGDFIESLCNQWREEFDVILVDSRTGITDAGGVCTIQLPDVLVLVFSANEQSLLGAKNVAQRAQRARQKLVYDRMPLLVFPLPARFDGRTEFEESQKWLDLFAEHLHEFYADWLPAPYTALQILEKTKLPYIAYFSFGEKLPVVSHSISDPEGLGYAYNVAATLIAEEFKETERLLRGIVIPQISHTPELIRRLRVYALPAVNRAQAGDALASIGDSRFRADAWYLPDDPLLGFVEIPAGPFLMGSNDKRNSHLLKASPQHTLTLQTYYIALYPVTVAQFQAFVEASGHEWTERERDQGPLNHPVVYVSWHDAMAYCDWLTVHMQEWSGTPEPLATLLHKKDWRVILPSEAEWEKAARGTDGRAYPWGNGPDPDWANYRDTGINGTSAVGCFPRGASPYGVEETSGNVWEWTRSLAHDYPYPSSRAARAKREDLQASLEESRVLRGGAFWRAAQDVCCACRDSGAARDSDGGIGFRVALAGPL
jgi:formylglycine-generating enzyme required for sulfatase activity